MIEPTENPEKGTEVSPGTGTEIDTGNLDREEINLDPNREKGAEEDR